MMSLNPYKSYFYSQYNNRLSTNFPCTFSLSRFVFGVAKNPLVVLIDFIANSIEQ